MKSTRIAGALIVVGALAAPAAASAHPSVYTDTAQIVADPSNPGTVTPQTRYVVANHGFTYVLRESNGLVAADHKGVFDYKSLPGAYRATLATWDDLLQAGASGAQAHATCQVPKLESEAAITDWQGTDPFYAYVPFQRDSAGLEDDPAEWIPVVQKRTGVDLATVATAADAEAKCEALPGATASSYAPADATQTTRSAFNAGLIEHETAPLVAQIATLTTAATDADKAKLALQGLLDAARAELARLTAAAAPMRVALPSATAKARQMAKNGVALTVNGPAAEKVTVRLTITAKQAGKLGLKSSTLASAAATLGSDGTVAVTLKPARRVTDKLARLKRAIALTATAVAGDRRATTTGTVTR